MANALRAPTVLPGALLAFVMLSAACGTETGASTASAPPLAAPPPEGWVRQFGSTGPDEASSVAVDAGGNVYVAGWTAADIEGEIGAGSYDSFLRKYDASGMVLWTRQFGSPDQDGASQAAIDADGSIYVVGRVGGQSDGETAGGRWDAYVRKYDPNGTDIWTRRFGSDDLDWANGVAVDRWGNVYVAGATLGTLPGQTASGRGETFLRKYDSSGVELWTRQFGTGGKSEAADVAVDPPGNVYVLGSTLGSLPGQSSNGSWDGYLRKYDPSGVELWTRQFGSADGDTAQAVAVDRQGNVFVAGTTRGTLPGQVRIGGFLDAFIARFDSSGTLIWMRQFGSGGTDIGSGLTLDPEGNVYVAGRTEDHLPGGTNAGEFDAFLRKYDPLGRHVWTKQFGSGVSDFALSAAIGPARKVYAVGSGALPGLPRAGERDAFVVQLVQ